MALKLISILSILVLASFAYKVWDKTKVPEEIPIEDVWKVKTIEFVCRILHKLESLMAYLNFDVHIGRPLLSFAFDTMHYGIWPLTGSSPNHDINESSVKTYNSKMAGVPVILHKSKKGTVKTSGSEKKPQPVLIYFHGGGWEWLNAAYPSPTLTLITSTLGIPTVSVEYRLAPENPYPAALQDCLAVTNYIIKHHKELNVNPDKIMVAGDSAGGNLAAAVSLKLKKKLRLQVLIYPGLQAMDVQTPSYRENAGKLKYIINLGDVIEYVGNYGAISPAGRSLMQENKHISKSKRMSKYSSYTHSNLINQNVTKLATLSHNTVTTSVGATVVNDIEKLVFDPMFMPLMSDSLDGVTDAYIVTAQHDILRDDGLFYAARLSNSSDVKVKLENYREGFHAFFHFSQGPLRLMVAQKAISDLIKFIDQEVIMK